MNLNGTVVEVELPRNLSSCDAMLLQKCEGRVLFLKSVRARVPWADVDHASYFNGGVSPDTLSLLAAYKLRFPAVITRVYPGRMSAVALGTGPLPAGVALQNTGPFDLCNGEPVCFFPPVFDCVCNTVRLESVDSTVVFPATLPSSVYAEVLGKVMSRAVEAVAAGRVVAPGCRPVGNGQDLNQPGAGPAPFRDADTVTYNGRQYHVSPDLRHLDSTEPSVRTLALNVMFTVTEGTMLILAMVPHLLALGANDGYVNALVGLQTATRSAGQLIRIPQPEACEDAARRFPLYEALAAWLQMAVHLGEAFGTKAMLRVCTFDGPSSVKPGEMAPVIANWF